MLEDQNENLCHFVDFGEVDVHVVFVDSEEHVQYFDGDVDVDLGRSPVVVVASEHVAVAGEAVFDQILDVPEKRML